MPISTPKETQKIYKDDIDHFSHVLHNLFIPAIKEAGFDPISPKAVGADVVQAEIIKQLVESDLVLCDMSLLMLMYFLNLESELL